MPAAAWKAKADSAEYDNMRQRLVTAAWEYACIHGLDRLTLNAVAEQAGCARSSVYRYFDNKDQLLGAVWQDRVLAIGRDLDAELMRWDDPREQLVRSLYLAVTRVRSGPSLELFRSLLVNDGRHMADIALEYIPRIAPEVFTIAPIYTRAREEGLMREEISDEDVLRWLVTVAIALVQQDSLGTDPEQELAFLRRMLVPSIFRVQNGAGAGLR